jgi:protein-tyrosine phosphatase
MKGRNRAPAFAAAYLMHSQRCTRVQALSQISVLVSFFVLLQWNFWEKTEVKLEFAGDFFCLKL